MAMVDTENAVFIEEEEKRMKHYSSYHRILLVGEGDFSFSLSLARSFASASNIVATSLDPSDIVARNYKEAKSNLEELEKLGACILHGVDATKMMLHTDLQMRKFDRIIFNFPHAGFYGKEDETRVIWKHKNLVSGFFENASGMLCANGEIHVNHKITAPFCNWNLVELASHSSLALIGYADFNQEDYPGYNNKRGAGPRCDEPFPLGECGTFKFIFSPPAMKMFRVINHHLHSTHRPQPPLQEVPFIPMQQPPTSVDSRYPGTNVIANVNDVSGYAGLPSTFSITHTCRWVFKEYFDLAAQTFGRTDYDIGCSVQEALRLGFERYMAEVSGRTMRGYVDLLTELYHLSALRSSWLRKILVDLHHDHNL